MVNCIRGAAQAANEICAAGGCPAREGNRDPTAGGASASSRSEAARCSDHPGNPTPTAAWHGALPQRCRRATGPTAWISSGGDELGVRRPAPYDVFQRQRCSSCRAVGRSPRHRVASRPWPQAGQRSLGRASAGVTPAVPTADTHAVAEAVGAAAVVAKMPTHSGNASALGAAGAACRRAAVSPRCHRDRLPCRRTARH